jgi:hypothetical protein
MTPSCATGTVRAGAMAMALALLGVLGGHLATYALLFPDAHVHDRVLAGSGHGWTALMGPAVLTAVAIALGLGVLSGLGRGRARSVRFTTLLVLQVGIFAGLEIAERAASSGLTLASLQHHLVDHGLASILVVGTLIQVVTAWFGSTVSRVVAAVARLRPTTPPRRRLAQRRLTPAIGAPPLARPARSHATRAPPRLVAVPTPTT